MIDALILKNLIDNLPCSSAYKDVNSVFTHANAEYAKIVELKHPLDVVGRTAYDMPARSSECAALVHEQDKKVIKSGKPLSLLGIHPDAQGKFKAYKFLKTPLRNGSGEVDGIFVVGDEVEGEIVVGKRVDGELVGINVVGVEIGEIVGIDVVGEAVVGEIVVGEAVEGDIVVGDTVVGF